MTRRRWNSSPGTSSGWCGRARLCSSSRRSVSRRLAGAVGSRFVSQNSSKARARAPVLAGPPGSDPLDAEVLYDADTLAALGFDPERDLGYPGLAPFTRGVQPNMYRGRLWTMRQYAGFGTAEESNRRYHYLLAQGQTGLSVAFDLPTQMGRDSDEPVCAGEVGRVGVAIDSLGDMRRLLAGLPLGRISTSMTINATAPILLALYLIVGEEQGVAHAELRGTIQNDVLKEYVARGTYIYPPRPSLRLVKDVFAFAAQELPRFNTISISGYHMREAGCDAVQEVAFTLANGLEYVRTATAAGLDVDRFGSRLSFFFGAHNNLIEEVAKFRAARRLWARLMRERFGAKSDRACALRFHCQTAGCTLLAQQPMVNVVRVAIQALAAVMGGCQSLHTNSFDEAVGLPTQEAAIVALRTQQVIGCESGLGDFVDPLGGSFAVEALTCQIERAARAYLERIDALGGMVAAIEKGYVQREIQNSAYRYQLDVERRRRIVVGQNEFVAASAPLPVLRIDPALEREQAERVRVWRAEHDGPAKTEALARVDAAARGDDNLLPPIVAAVRAGATVGEVSQVLRAIWGEHVEVPTL
ncbi:MAG: methylmalonyl-CoA mutase [Deltaproteobacteria bacterium]|nr:methylmalonyl-CoA mutase [Deltaproteobacteria bacterium]